MCRATDLIAELQRTLAGLQSNQEVFRLLLVPCPSKGLQTVLGSAAFRGSPMFRHTGSWPKLLTWSLAVAEAGPSCMGLGAA